MPIVDVTYGSRVTDDRLRLLAELLPQAVSVAVACPEEPYVPPLVPGDVIVRFQPFGRYDESGLDLLVEVRSKWFESRSANRQERCDQLCAAITSAAGTSSVGVYLSLPVAAWAQGDAD